MAAITPAAAGTANYIDPIRGLATGVVTAGESYLVEGTVVATRLTFITELYYFNSVGDGDTWASGISGIQAAFWQGDANGADAASATLDTAAGSIEFETNGGSALSGWVLLFIDPTTSGRSGRTGN